MLSTYHARVRHELEAHGGTVEKFIGDAVVAVFGAPVAHEDDPERAVRAALAIQEAIAELNEAEPGLELEVRIGVNTGEALVALEARPEAGEGMVSGDVINTAARLQSAAPPGGDPRRRADATGRPSARSTTRQHEPVRGEGQGGAACRRGSRWPARASFGVEDVDVGDARLSSAASARSRCSRTLSRASAATSGPQLITLVGVPGIGKSRLVQELCAGRRRRPRSHHLAPRAFAALRRGSPVLGARRDREGAGRHPRVGRRRGGRGEALAVRSTALVSDRAEAAWVEQHLRPLVGLPVGRAPAVARRGVRRLAPLPRGARRGSGRPCSCFEDLHWADDDLLDFVDELVERARRRAAAARLHGAARAARRAAPVGAAGKLNALTLSLSPLSDDETARLLARAPRPGCAAGGDAGADRAAGRGACRSSPRSTRECSSTGEPLTRAAGEPAGARRCAHRRALGAGREGAAAGRGRARQGVLDGCARRRSRRSTAADSTSGCARSSGRSSSAASAARPSKARGSTCSCMRSCATSPTGRSLVRSAPTSTAARPTWISRPPGRPGRGSRRDARASSRVGDRVRRGGRCRRRRPARRWRLRRSARCRRSRAGRSTSSRRAAQLLRPGARAHRTPASPDPELLFPVWPGADVVRRDDGTRRARARRSTRLSRPAIGELAATGDGLARARVSGTGRRTDTTLLDRALELVDGRRADAVARARARCGRGTSGDLGRPAGHARACDGGGRDRARESGISAAEAEALNSLGVVQSNGGDTRSALETTRRALELSLEGGGGDTPRCYVNVATFEFDCGLLEEAAAHQREGLALSSRVGATFTAEWLEAEIVLLDISPRHVGRAPWTKALVQLQPAPAARRVPLHGHPSCVWSRLEVSLSRAGTARRGGRSRQRSSRVRAVGDPQLLLPASGAAARSARHGRVARGSSCPARRVSTMLPGRRCCRPARADVSAALAWRLVDGTRRRSNCCADR